MQPAQRSGSTDECGFSFSTKQTIRSRCPIPKFLYRGHQVCNHVGLGSLGQLAISIASFCAPCKSEPSPQLSTGMIHLGAPLYYTGWALRASSSDVHHMANQFAGLKGAPDDGPSLGGRSACHFGPSVCQMQCQMQSPSGRGSNEKSECARGKCRAIRLEMSTGGGRRKRRGLVSWIVRLMMMYLVSIKKYHTCLRRSCRYTFSSPPPKVRSGSEESMYLSNFRIFFAHVPAVGTANCFHFLFLFQTAGTGRRADVGAPGGGAWDGWQASACLPGLSLACS